jgi:hypothetical protein
MAKRDLSDSEVESDSDYEDEHKPKTSKTPTKKSPGRKKKSASAMKGPRTPEEYVEDLEYIFEEHVDYEKYFGYVGKGLPDDCTAYGGPCVGLESCACTNADIYNAVVGQHMSEEDIDYEKINDHFSKVSKELKKWHTNFPEEVRMIASALLSTIQSRVDEDEDDAMPLDESKLEYGAIMLLLE